MAEKIVIKGPSLGFFSLLTVLFVGLKLTGHIDWSWLWVLSPLLAPFAILGSVLGLMFVVALGVALFEKKRF